jgi:hypothetical protein
MVLLWLTLVTVPSRDRENTHIWTKPLKPTFTAPYDELRAFGKICQASGGKDRWVTSPRSLCLLVGIFFLEREREKQRKTFEGCGRECEACTNLYIIITLWWCHIVLEMYATFNCVQHPSHALFARIQLQRKGWSELDGVLRLRTTVLLKFSRNGILLWIQFEDE